MNGKEWSKDHLFPRTSGPGPGVSAPAGLLAWLSRVHPCDAQRIGGLDIFPLRLDGEVAPARLLLGDEAIARGLLEIRERGDGVVQELEAHNHADVPVLLLDGETLVGCKQNRVVAHPVIIAAGATVVVPVGCLQQGRWNRISDRFRVGAMRVDPTFRREAVRETSAARASLGRVRLDQSRLWRQVSESLSTSSVASPSSDYQELLGREQESLHREAAALKRLPGEVGIVAFLGGEFLGLELLGHPDHWNKVAARTLPSYVLSARHARGSGRRPGGAQAARDILGWLRSAKVDEHIGLGLGVDLLIAAGKHHGSGLWFESAPACLSLFAEA